MQANTNPTPNALQPRRYSGQKSGNLRGRPDLLTPRTSVDKRGYFQGQKNEELSVHEQFIRACANGDYTTVHRILTANQISNIDVTNQLGRTAMQLAIENEHLEVVTLLLDRCDGQKMREAILLAIYLGRVQIAEACILHPQFKTLNERGAFRNDEAFWMTPSYDDAQFAPDITPLILAAQYNRTEIVQLLLRSGNRITKPHDYHCRCLQCHQKFKFDSLRHAQSRLNAYRGLASESYISLAAIDPILTAFELGRELRDLSGKEKYFKNEYMTLADQLSAYAVKLLDKVRGHKELNCVLEKAGKETEEKRATLARLYLAIKYEEKPFVAHSNCQQKLVEIWHSQIRNLFKLNPLLISLLTVLYIFILPFACVLYILTSWSKLTIKFQDFLKQPCIKFLGHTISYAVFIILIIVSSFLFAGEFNKDLERLSKRDGNISKALNSSIENIGNLTNCTIYPKDDLVFRPATLTWIDMIISVFVIGFLWHELKQAYNDGLQDYLLSWNNIVDSCMNILYLSSFALKYYVIYQVVISTRELSTKGFVEDVGKICELNATRQMEIYKIFYWLNADRFYWASFDPINVAEGLFAIANIFSFSRICFLLPAFQHLGPLQISLGRMMSDIGKFIIIFLIIFSGFMFGLNNLFWYYKGSVRIHVEVISHDKNDRLPAEKFFGTMSSTFKTVFWSLFGLAEKEGVQLEDYGKDFTEMIGYFIYGAFNIASVIVLLNMLIAMMSKSYETIEEHADVEWKFARSKLYMEYIKDGGILPVPFNIIPTPKDVYYFFRRLICYTKRCRKPKEKDLDSTETNNPVPMTVRTNGPNRKALQGKSPNIPAISNGRMTNLHLNEDHNARTRQASFDVNQRLTYRKVMNRVIKRFLLHKQREEQEGIRESDFEELKQDIQMLRFEMLNRLEGTRDDLRKNSQLLNEGVVIVGELLTLTINDSNPLIKENFHLFKRSFYQQTDSGIESNASTNSIISISNLSTNIPQELDLDSESPLRALSLTHVRLQKIVEVEEMENLHKSIRFIDDDEELDEEVPARHMSVQTSGDHTRMSSRF